ncbi:MAG: 30S ribosomal protein S6 [Rickettsiales bacterium]
MPLYETTFITRQDMPRADINKLTEELSTIVEQGGGKIVKNEYWGLKSLAYRVEKNRKGHYTMLGIDAPTDAIKELERTMRLNEDIIRVLTISVEAMEEGPSVMMQQARHSDESAPEAKSAPAEEKTETSDEPAEKAAAEAK